jgi:diguanylate cyclase (GGDEF)-like protein/PAS domain S-box-containing protein
VTASLTQNKLRFMTLVLGMLALVSLIAIMVIPPSTSLMLSHIGMLSLHLLLELFAIIIAILIVTISWHTFEISEANSAKILICGFIVVACCDVMHALAYQGMPALLTESSTSKAIFFWLMGRTVEVGSMALIAAGWAPPLSRKSWLGIGLAVSGLLIWFGSYHIDAFPVTFIEGKGVTGFKAAYEYALCFLNIAVAFMFWRRAGNTHQSRNYLLALSSFVMGIGEISFTAYVTPSDFQNIFGHVYKLLAYSLLYRATFVTGIRAPYERIRQSEIKLRESEARYHSALSSLSEGVAIQGLGGEILAANHAAGAILGLSPDHLTGRRLSDPDWRVMHEDGTPWPADQHPSIVALRTGNAVSDAIMGIHKPDGTLCWISVNVEPIVAAAAAAPRTVVTSFTDITSRKDTETQLRIAAIAFESQDSIMITDSNSVILQVNKAFTECTGYTTGEIVGRTPRLLKSGRHDRDFYRAMWETLGRTGTWQGEIWDKRKSGEIYPKWLSITAVRGSDGSVTHYVSSHIDMTERQRMQSETESQLRRNQTLMQNSLDGIHIMDVQGNIIETNDAFCNMLGYTRQEARSLNIADWNSQYPKQILLDRLRNSIGKSSRFETTHRRKDGKLLHVEISTAGIEIDGQPFIYASSRDITERKAAEEEIRHLAFNDQLTKLPNRQFMLARLQEALASGARIGKRGALLLIDLDNFKTLNDTLGHDIGDLLLQQVAERLKSSVREADLVARLGGDEFVVMLENLSEYPPEAAAQTEIVGGKILSSLGQIFQLGANEYHCTASIGAVLFNGNAQTTDELMKQADIAMYQAKKAGRNNLRFFDPQMQDSVNTRAVLESELRKALENRQFQLYYQIQVDSSSRPLGAESLIRWLHPERGMILPAQFIPLAEETGLILPIGLWVLDAACAQIRAWQQQPHTCGLVLAVNVSARQFHQDGFVAQVKSALQRHEIDPTLLKLELTEGMLLEDIDDTITTMYALNDIGVQFSLDDFGTGYSSLQYLKRLPLDQIKIDQSFVRDIATDSSDKAIVRTIIAMARSLDIAVIAEGVETEEQRQFLMSNGCTHYQGYLFGKPVPGERFDALLKREGSMFPDET